MAVNIRTKGQNGEREVATLLNSIVAEVRNEMNLTPFEKRDEIFQRNQNQSAVGGSDLSNNLDLEIEVKRQEQLSINTWWKQTLESASRTGGIPILIFKQNRKKWRVIMEGYVTVNKSLSSPEDLVEVRVEISLGDFEKWFKTYYTDKLVWQTSNK